MVEDTGKQEYVDGFQEAHKRLGGGAIWTLFLGQWDTHTQWPATRFAAICVNRNVCG